MPAKGKDVYSIQAVENALILLEALADVGGGASLAWLSERLGANKASLFRLLATCERLGYVERRPGTRDYFLGAAAFEIGQKFLNGMELLRKAKPLMEELARESKEAVYLVIRRNDEVLFLDAVDTLQRVKLVSQVGKRFPLGVTAPGKVMLAYDRVALQASVEDEELARVCRDGACVDRHGVCGESACAAVPVFDATGEVVGVLALLVPEFRVSVGELNDTWLPLLRSAAGIVSSRLGYLVPHLARKHEEGGAGSG